LLLVAVLVGLVGVAAPWSREFRRLQLFIAGAVLLAAIGMAISLAAPFAPDMTARVLRFYWFRLSDVMVPVGVSLLTCSVLWQWQRSGAPWLAAALALAMLGVGMHLGQVLWNRHLQPWPPADTAIVQVAGWPRSWEESGLAAVADWRAVCQWAATDTPPDAVFLTPRLAHTFGWYAGRSEVVNRKNLPQDAAGIVEWWRRLRHVYGTDDGAGGARWRASLAEMKPEQLRALGREFGADYVITTASPPLALDRVGPANASFAVYRLNGDDRGGTSGSAESPRRDVP
jgi:hypothetical protein